MNLASSIEVQQNTQTLNQNGRQVATKTVSPLSSANLNGTSALGSSYKKWRKKHWYLFTTPRPTYSPTEAPTKSKAKLRTRSYPSTPAPTPQLPTQSKSSSTSAKWSWKSLAMLCLLAFVPVCVVATMVAIYKLNGSQIGYEPIPDGQESTSWDETEREFSITCCVCVFGQ